MHTLRAAQPGSHSLRARAGKAAAGPGTGLAVSNGMVIGQYMTSNPVTADSTSSVGDVLTKLYELDVRHIPIVDDSELVGIVSDRDIRQFAAPMIGDVFDVELRKRLEAPISEYMATDLITLTAEADVSEAIEIMLDQRIGAVPVVDADTSELIGIVSYIDILKAVQPLV